MPCSLDSKEEMLHLSDLKLPTKYFLLIPVVLQVVNDITTFYMQTYNNYKATGDERLKETLRVIQNGVSQSLTSVLFYSKLFQQLIIAESAENNWRKTSVF